MRNNKAGIQVFLIVATLVLTACTDGQPEFERLSSLGGVEFDGDSTKTVTFWQLGPPINVEGECDRSTSHFLVSIDNGETWGKAENILKGKVVNNCRAEGKLSLEILTDNTGAFVYTKGTPSQKTVKIMAKDSDYTSKESKILLNYEPNSQVKPAIGKLVNPAAGVVEGASYHLKYRIGPTAASRAKGSFYEVQSSQ